VKGKVRCGIGGWGGIEERGRGGVVLYEIISI